MWLRLPYPVVAEYDDRVKATHWELIDDIEKAKARQQKKG